MNVQTRRTKSQYRDVNNLLNAIQPPSENIKTSVKVITESNDTSVLPGEVVSVLIGFENTGDKTFTVTDICATFTNHYDNTQMLRNYSAVHHNISVRSGDLHTFEYMIQLDQKMTPFSYGFVVAVFGHCNGEEYTQIPLNGTIVVKESPAAISTRSFLIIVAFLSGLITLGVFYRVQIKAFVLKFIERVKQGDFRFRRGGKKAPKVRKHNVNTGNPEKDELINAQREEEDEWLQGTSSMSYVKRQRARRAISQSPNPPVVRQSRGRSPTTVK